MQVGRMVECCRFEVREGGEEERLKVRVEEEGAASRCGSHLQRALERVLVEPLQGAVAGPQLLCCQ